MSAVLKVRRSMGDPFELRMQDRTSHNRTQQWYSVSIDRGLRERWSGWVAPFVMALHESHLVFTPLGGIREGFWPGGGLAGDESTAAMSRTSMAGKGFCR